METLLINTVDDLQVLTDEVFTINIEIKIITPSSMRQIYTPLCELELLINSIKDFINIGIDLGYTHHSWYDEEHKAKIHILSK